MTRPLDIVAAAVHAAQCGCGTVEQVAYDTAQVAVNALTDERVADRAAEALGRDNPWGLSVAARHDIAMTVLRSVGEA